MGWVAFVFVTAAFAVSARAQTSYILTDLGDLGGGECEGHDINESGQIVGLSTIASDPNLDHAFLWQDGSITDLGTLGGTRSYGYGINEVCQIAGQAMSNVHGDDWKRAYRWEAGVMSDLGTLGGPYAFAWDINDLGEVVGSAAPDNYQGHAFLYTGGAMTDLGTLGGLSSYAYGLNNATQIVGWAKVENNVDFHAFLWDGAMTDLGTLGGTRSEARDINEVGKVVGFAQRSDGTWHAFLWDGVMSDLGTLTGNYSKAYGINVHDHIVGWSYTVNNDYTTRHACLWQDGALVDLNDLIDPNSGWILSEARSINDLGQIVGFGEFAGAKRGFLLTPVRQLTVMVNNPDHGTVTLDPVPGDPNAPAYPAGTTVTLTALPGAERSFNRWEIDDPNYPGDANHATVDANTVITIVMDVDREVKAVFNCGSGVPMMLPLALLGAVGLIRRLR